MPVLGACVNILERSKLRREKDLKNPENLCLKRLCKFGQRDTGILICDIIFFSHNTFFLPQMHSFYLSNDELLEFNFRMCLTSALSQFVDISLSEGVAWKLTRESDSM